MTAFSQPDATAVPWERVDRVLAAAEVMLLTTVRADGRPHAVPLLALWHDGRIVVCTGAGEQKARNLASSSAVLVTVQGTTSFSSGLDVVVEGLAERVTEGLAPLAAAFGARFGEDWLFLERDGGWVQGDQVLQVFSVVPSKVLAFGRSPYTQTRYRWPQPNE